jgi:transposase-like protein
MPKKYYKAEEIINILRQVEILTSQGQTVQMAARGVGISEQTYYRWRKEYGGMQTDQAQREYAPEELFFAIVSPVLGGHTGPRAITLCGYSER